MEAEDALGGRWQDQADSDGRVQRLLAPAISSVTMNSVDPISDIAVERNRASFDPREICSLLHGGESKMERKSVRHTLWQGGHRTQSAGRLMSLTDVLRAELLKIVKKLPGGDKASRPNMSREEEHVAALQAALDIW